MTDPNSGYSGEYIEYLEAAGYRDLFVITQRLPVEFSGSDELNQNLHQSFLNKLWALGVRVAEDDPDAYFNWPNPTFDRTNTLAVALPSGWQMEATEGPCSYHIVDADQKEMLSAFVRKGPEDRPTGFAVVNSDALGYIIIGDTVTLIPRPFH